MHDADAVPLGARITFSAVNPYMRERMGETISGTVERRNAKSVTALTAGGICTVPYRLILTVEG